jgi:ADP-ribosylglycohydrolase
VEGELMSGADLNLRERFEGCLLGLAVGDALGGNSSAGEP